MNKFGKNKWLILGNLSAVQSIIDEGVQLNYESFKKDSKLFNDLLLLAVGLSYGNKHLNQFEMRSIYYA